MKKILLLVSLLIIYFLFSGFKLDSSKRELPDHINATHFLHCGVVISDKELLDCNPLDYIAFVGDVDRSFYKRVNSIKEVKELADLYFVKTQSEILSTITTDLIKDENNHIKQIIYQIGDQVIGVTTFNTTQNTNKGNFVKLVGPSKIIFCTNDYRNLSDITSQFYLHNLDTYEPLDSCINVKVGKEYYPVSDINNLSNGTYQAVITKKLLCGSKITTEFTLVKNNKDLSDNKQLEFADNQIHVSLDNTRPTINEVIKSYQKEMLKNGKQANDISILFTNYDKYDYTGQESYAIITYLASDAKMYQDRIYITKSPIHQKNTLKYNLITTFSIISVILISVLIVVIKSVILRKKLKKQLNKKNS